MMSPDSAKWLEAMKSEMRSMYENKVWTLVELPDDRRTILSVFWERGSPDLPACGLRRGSKGAQHGPSSSTQTQDPREGPSLVGQTIRSFLRQGLIRLAREEAERSRRGNSRGARDASHDDQGRQAGASPRSVPLSSLVQRGQAQTRSTEASSKDFHIGATRPRPEGRQGGGHHGAQDGVITRAFCRRRPPFVRITCTSCPPSKLANVGSLPA